MNRSPTRIPRVLVPLLLLALGTAGCRTAPGPTPEWSATYAPTFREWVDLSFQTYATRLSYPGVFRVIWDRRGDGRFVFVSSLEYGDAPFGTVPIQDVMHEQVILMADTVRRLSLDWTERGYPVDHTRIRFVMSFPPRQEIEVPVWRDRGAVRRRQTL